MPREILAQPQSPDSISMVEIPEFHEALSRREKEVLQLRARGLLVKEIAGILSLAPRTVKHHLSNASSKLNCNSALGSVLTGIDLGVIDPFIIVKDLRLDTTSLENLTPREREVLKTVAESRTKSRISNGKNLSIKPNTIKSHSSAIRGKLGKGNPLASMIPAVLLWIVAEKKRKL